MKHIELNTTKNYTITEIESFTFEDAYILATDRETVKGHDVLFIDIAGAFGYSAIVFMNGKQIKHANQYELHYKHMDYTREELKAKYIDILNHRLYEEEELTSVENYEDYRAKANFLQNDYACRVDYISIFGIFQTDEDVKAHKEKTKGMVYDPIGLCYIDDADFVKKHVALFDTLTEAWNEKQNDKEALKKAYLSEMFNHEYGINWQADYDVINVFAQVPYMETASTVEYCEKAGFSKLQINAYLDAKNEYYRVANF